MGEIYQCDEYLKQTGLLPAYGSNLQALCARDYPRKGYFRDTEISALDLDKYEAVTAKGEKDCTADAAIGIATLLEGRLGNERILLTELRLGYETTQRFQYSSIAAKYRHSCDLLRAANPDIRLDQRFALIYTASLQPEAQSQIKRWARGNKEAANWDTFSPESYCNYINYGKDIPVKVSKYTEATVNRLKRGDYTEMKGLKTLYDEVNDVFWELYGKRSMVDLEYFVKEIAAMIMDLAFTDITPSQEYIRSQILEILNLDYRDW